jgi:hypothetical protein
VRAGVRAVVWLHPRESCSSTDHADAASPGR